MILKMLYPDYQAPTVDALANLYLGLYETARAEFEIPTAPRTE